MKRVNPCSTSLVLRNARCSIVLGGVLLSFVVLPSCNLNPQPEDPGFTDSDPFERAGDESATGGVGSSNSAGDSSGEGASGDLDEDDLVVSDDSLDADPEVVGSEDGLGASNGSAMGADNPPADDSVSTADPGDQSPQDPSEAEPGVDVDDGDPQGGAASDDGQADDSAADDSTMDDTVTDDSGGGMFVPPPGCEDVPTAIFGVELKCGGIGCHGTPDVAPLAASDLGNMTDDLVTRLPASNGTGVCADYPLVDVDDPDNSLLITKLSESPPCGSPMPAGGTISDEERNCIIEWTRAVAAAAQ